VKLGLIGLPQSGKTTLFEILTAQAPPAGGRPENRMGTARILDGRLDKLVEMYRPKKVTPATLEVVDPATPFPPLAPRGKGGDADPYGPLRLADALALVIRAFENDTVPHPFTTVDPARDLAKAEEELVLLDHVAVESRLERIEKMEKVGRKAETGAERPVLERLREWLDSGKPLRSMAWSDEEERTLRGYSFLSRLPLVVVYNVGESTPAELPAPPPGAVAVSLPARAECEVVRLPEEERAGFRELFQIPESGLETLLRAAQKALDLLSFFTAGPPEVRAWHLRRGGSAVDAAGKIHTDLARGFVRAEVMPYEQLLEAGSWSGGRERGWLRTEGRDYVVQDGDVLVILHTS
jgi:GTP-binding protein YchF